MHKLDLFLGEHLEDHRRTCKWLGSPPFISHEVRPFVRGPTTPVRGLTITMVINHLLNGMILQVAPETGWLEYDPFLLGFGLFSGANLLASFQGG